MSVVKEIVSWRRRTEDKNWIELAVSQIWVELVSGVAYLKSIESYFDLSCWRRRTEDKNWIELAVSQIWVELVSGVAYLKSIESYFDLSCLICAQLIVRRCRPCRAYCLLWLCFCFEISFRQHVILEYFCVVKSTCFFCGKGYTGPLSSSRSFEVRRSMALIIMKWMDLSLKECRISLGIVLVDILEDSNSATELLRFLGHMTHCFRGARSSFGSSSFCIRDRTRCHYWKRATCRSFVFHELVRGRFVYASLGFRELDSLRDFCVAFGRSN
ncbi:hypothetical protein DY000_02015088 [Brassica cretica]|uniref:Uncharacterized protein n=1 Tax=Brassica cretica TaxID=69181 RepID=A0ABQ7CUU5_BRACR|nr:hypothetical protein DY000_02015088 [Brassica cretica]